MELGNRIKELRKAQSINQDDLAEKLFVSRQTISNWENDKSYPDIQSVLLLSEIFGVSIDNLLKGDVEKMEEIISEDTEMDMKKMIIYSRVMVFLFCGIDGFNSDYGAFIWMVVFCSVFNMGCNYDLFLNEN